MLGASMRRSRGSCAFSLLVALAFAAPARAVPGPATTAVLANADVPESVILARRYAAARALPEGQVCALALPTGASMDLATFESALFSPLEACLGAAAERIEAIVLVRGVPLRVTGFADGRQASLAAVLGTWRSTQLVGGASLRALSPGIAATCGTTPCYAARWRNPFRGGTFEPGWEQTRDGVRWRPVLVTRLDGRSFEAAEGLLTSALEAEAAGGVPGDVLLMEGADGARGVLDVEFPFVLEALAARDVPAEQVPFETDLSDRDLAAFVTGTARLGDAIEGNRFAPGSIVDNLTSLGAVPRNFEATGESQVSIARWVAAGVAGAHGATAEPLNNSFPSRRFLVDYVDGSTLAEAYHRNLPFAFWQNLVLGDPMAAPHARRPEVDPGLEDDAVLAGPTLVMASAVDPVEGRGVAVVAAFFDGVALGEAEGERLELCLAPATEEHTLLVVAQAAAGPAGPGAFRPKGWTVRRAAVTASAGCGNDDMGAADMDAADLGDDMAGLDMGAGDAGSGGAAPRGGCAASPPPVAFALGLGRVASVGRRR